MLDSIQIGMSGLLGFSSGLRVIANNTANLSTPGFKGSRPQFADQFYAGTSLAGNGSGDHFSAAQSGGGLNVFPSVIDWRQGELRQSGNDLDLAVDGLGLFTLRGADGQTRYTRAGQFKFNEDDVLVNRNDGSTVMQDVNGRFETISLTGLRSNAAVATSSIKFSGNLSSTAGVQTISAIPLIDRSGKQHQLTLTATSIVSSASGAVDGNTWSLALKDDAGLAAVASGNATLTFTNGQLDAASAAVKMVYTPAGQSGLELNLDFGSDVTAFASGSSSTLALKSADGTVAGELTKVSFDAKGALALSYSNGKTATGARLSLGRFESQDTVRAVGDNQFEATSGRPWQRGLAGEGALGSIRSGVVEISNVDLSGEFSNLVVMQRGYQASSQVITTANEMLQELFSMRGK